MKSRAIQEKTGAIHVFPEIGSFSVSDLDAGCYIYKNAKLLKLINYLQYQNDE